VKVSMTRWIVIVMLIVLTVAFLQAQAPGGTPFRIEKLDPALDEIIAADAKLEILGDRFALTEGPSLDSSGGRIGWLSSLQRQCGECHLQVGTQQSPLSVFLHIGGISGTSEIAEANVAQESLCWNGVGRGRDPLGGS